MLLPFSLPFLSHIFHILISYISFPAFHILLGPSLPIISLFHHASLHLSLSYSFLSFATYLKSLPQAVVIFQPLSPPFSLSLHLPKSHSPSSNSPSNNSLSISSSPTLNFSSALSQLSSGVPWWLHPGMKDPKQVLVDLPSALSGRGISVIFIIITEVIMVNWWMLIGFYYTTP